LIVPLIAAGLVLALLAAWLFSVNGQLSDTRAALAGEESRVTKLNGRVSALNTQVSKLKSEKSDLQSQNSSLTSAMLDCRDAASKTRGIFRLLNQNASLEDLRAAGKEANRAWFECRTEASSNGAL
jgi:chromosome segregation ATPase